MEKRNSADLDGSAMKRDAKRDAPWPTKTLNYGVNRGHCECFFFCLNKTSIPDEEKNMKRFFYKQFQVGHFEGGFAEKNVD